MFAARAPKAALGAKGTSSKQSAPRPEQPHNHHHHNNSPKASKSARTSSKSPSSTLVATSAPAWRTLQEDQDETMHSADKASSSLAVGDDSLYYNTRKTIVALFGPLPREVEEALAKTGKERSVIQTMHTLLLLRKCDQRYPLHHIDFYSEPMTAKVDVDAGYGVVVSKSKCYIWAVQKVVQGTIGLPFLLICDGSTNACATFFQLECHLSHTTTMLHTPYASQQPPIDRSFCGLAIRHHHQLG